jgi:hypothetical protein
MSARTSALTHNHDIGANCLCGNWTLSARVLHILGQRNAFLLSGRNTQVITSAGKTFYKPNKRQLLRRDG